MLEKKAQLKMDWNRAPPNGFDETMQTLCWDADKSADDEGLVRLLREHAGGSLRHLHVRCAGAVNLLRSSSMSTMATISIVLDWES